MPIINRKCLRNGCEARLPLGQLYCLECRPPGFQVLGPDGKYIQWENHPDFKAAKASAAPTMSEDEDAK